MDDIIVKIYTDRHASVGSSLLVQRNCILAEGRKISKLLQVIEIFKSGILIQIPYAIKSLGNFVKLQGQVRHSIN